MIPISPLPADDPRVILAKRIGGGENAASSVLKILYAEILTDLGYLYVRSDIKEHTWQEVSKKKMPELVQYYYTVASHAIPSEKAVDYLKWFQKKRKACELPYGNKIAWITSEMFKRTDGLRNEWKPEIQYAMEEHHLLYFNEEDGPQL